MSAEYIILCDQRGQPIGSAEKLSSHHANTPLHRAFSCYIFDDLGQLLVTRRAAAKKVWPTVWTNSVCGHPAPGEATEEAVRRRARYELGMEISDLRCVVPDYKYKTPPYRGIIEHEYCPIYLARAASVVVPNPLEVDKYCWLSWSDYLAAARADSTDAYSWWCKDQLRLLADADLVRHYTKSN